VDARAGTLDAIPDAGATPASRGFARTGVSVVDLFGQISAICSAGCAEEV
jgi:hypothetical protein